MQPMRFVLVGTGNIARTYVNAAPRWPRRRLSAW